MNKTIADDVKSIIIAHIDAHACESDLCALNALVELLDDIEYYFSF